MSPRVPRSVTSSGRTPAATEVAADRKGGSLAELLELAGRSEECPPELCLKIARAFVALGDPPSGYGWLARVADSPGPFAAWASAAAALAKFESRAEPPARR